MLTLMTMDQVRTNRNLRGFRSCSNATGLANVGVSQRQMFNEEIALLTRQARHDHRTREWHDHFMFAAGQLRVLPPAARQRLLAESRMGR